MLKILSGGYKLRFYGLLIFVCLFSNTLLFGQNLKFTSKPEKKGKVGEYYQYHITTDGSNFFSREIFLSSGVLPAGIDLVDNGDGTADMSGTLQEAGDFEIELTVRQFFNTKTQSFKLSVSKGVATITLSNLNTTYTGDPQSIGINTEPPGLEGIIVTYSGSGEPPTNAGTYNVEAYLENDNYEGNVSGVFQIAKAGAMINVSGLNVAYDGSPKPVTVTTEPENLDVTITYDGSSAVPVNRGNYAVYIVINNANYNGTYSGTLTIGKATAGITIDKLTSTYNGQPHPVTVITDPASLSYEVTYDGSGTAPVNSGSYAVKVKITDPNYQGEKNATLNISKAVASITLGGLNLIYNGSSRQVSVTTDPANLPSTVTYNGNTQKPINAGNYDVSVTINDQNYKGSKNATLNIAKAMASVTLSNLNQVYDGNPKMVSTATSPSGLSVKITYSGSRTPPTSVGSYTVEAVIDETNYKGNAEGTLIIVKGQAEVSLSNLTVTYNGEPQGVNVFTVPAGLQTSVTYDGQATLPREIGNYAVNAEINDANYEGFASGTFIIKEPEGVNARPVLTNVETTPIEYSQGDRGKPVSETVIINDFDNAFMKSARISISENFESDKDMLDYDNTTTPKIQGTYNRQTGILDLVGEDSRSNYEMAIKNATYRNNTFGAINYTNKKIQITVNDGFNDSDPAFRNAIISILPEIEIVNAFTPNGDNVNDTWNFVNLDQYSSVKISIFNANGQEVYKCLGFDCEWNGTYKGKDLPSGPYYYTISLNNDKRKYQGTVTILK